MDKRETHLSFMASVSPNFSLELVAIILWFSLFLRHVQRLLLKSLFLFSLLFWIESAWVGWILGPIVILIAYGNCNKIGYLW